jgi:hypothetical protein
LKTKLILTKTCERCEKLFEVSGKRTKNRFCSYSCANVRNRSPESLEKHRQSLIKYFKSPESEEHRAKRSLQITLLNKAGMMWQNNGKDKILLLDPNFYENNLTNPDEYFIIPFNNENLKVEDGDIWEEVYTD